ncbi:MAG: LysM peptidoglycan-binding domain-containing protein [Wenzhouxiangellaceae bacterium]|nr:LysM peptidoglycan-binding domain-containing protein [Wenzhouxiangellaceae bacterium]
MSDDDGMRSFETPADRLRAVARVAPARFLAVGAIALLTAGCQLLEPRPDPPRPTPAPVVEAAEPEPPPATLSRAIDLLQRGEGARARHMLEELVAENPDSPTLDLLLAQVRRPPEALLSGPYREIVVEPGDTISEIAERELGNALLFYSLARLNEIPVPGRIIAGSTMRVPERRPASTPPSAPGEGVDAKEPASGARDRSRAASEPRAANAASGTDSSPPTPGDLETVAEYLLVAGQTAEAWAMLLGAAREGRVGASGQRLLVDLAIDRSDRQWMEERWRDAERTIQAARAVIDPSVSGDRLDRQLAHIRAQRHFHEAVALQRNGDLEAAYAAARTASRTDASFDDAARLERSLEQALIDRYHERALRAWRDRDVDLAIRTWESLVEIAPDFEPARIYLDRARRLRDRLSAEPPGED